ncbi:hypothetical protein QTP88_018138 [Uroleucon formosanum]
MSLRSKKSFAELWTIIEKFSEENEIDLQILNTGSKRKRNQPNKLNDFALFTDTSIQNETVDKNIAVSVYWRQTGYMRVIDQMITNLEKRFSAESLQFAVSIDHFLSLDFHKGMLFINHYKDFRSINSLKAEIIVLKNCLPINYNFKDIQKIINNNVYPNLYKLIQVAITIPVASATCERSFSAMRRVKNWLRTSMQQNRFTNLASICIERDIANNIDTERILNKFALTNNRKINLL